MYKENMNLLLLKIISRDKYNNKKCLYKCFCGTEFIARQTDVSSKKTKSCGCYKVLKNKSYFTTHGKTNSRLYKLWIGIFSRCTNPNQRSYINYGAKGIKICSDWQNFSKFNQWALENGYADNLTIDRIDKNGNYEPSNCQWLSASENSKKEYRKYLYKGKFYTLSELCIKLGLKYVCISARLRRGWTFEGAILTPTRAKKVD